jgi:nucleotide-binding universal stress UspA family protein
MGRILVGVDGSGGSRRALQWAIDEAVLRGADIDVLHAYRTEYIYYVDFPAAHALPRLDVEAQAQVVVNEVLESVDNPKGVTIDIEYVNSGNPAGEMIDRSGDYEMIVLGSRGLGGIAGLLLGSVTHKVTQHARCPVTIIPAAD